MKKYRRFLSLFISILLVLTVIAPCASALSSDGFRGVWVSTVVNLDYPSKGTTDSGKLKAEAVKILDNIKSMGLNAVILQVRPTADAFYDSDIFPWSQYLTGEAGKAPSNDFDPLEFWVEEAHKRGLELHAWINPYRITKKTASEEDKTLESLPDGHPAKENPSWAIQHTDGNLYFDPGIPAVRQLIVDGVVEICENYDIDGIHLDDYFYPDSDFNDESTYNKYKGSFTSIENWRRNNVDLLVEKLHDTLEESYPDVTFGISPFGIWANSKTNAQGSATNGGESYAQHYADTRKWVKMEWLDYIAPQIYWHIGHELADYKTLVNWWSDVVSGTDVELIIGHAAYKVGNDSYSAWDEPDQLVAQLKLNDSIDNVSGSIFFRYEHIMASSIFKTISGYYSSSTASRLEGSNKGEYETAA